MSGLATFVRQSWLAIAVLLSFSSAIAETITVGGVGSLSPLIHILADDFQKQHPGITVNLIHPPVGTAGSIRALSAGKLDIALAGRALKANEGVTAVGKPWLITPLVLATNGGKIKNGLDNSEIVGIYSGQRRKWDDGSPIRLVLRGADETETKVLRTLAPEVNAAIDQTLKRQDLPFAENDLDALAALSKIRGSLGTTTLGLIKIDGKSLSALPINGQVATLANLQKGNYPLSRHYYLVTNPASSTATGTFLTYLTSAAALRIAARYEYGPLTALETSKQ
jgi:phosphate transport system substrate-binding protein